MRYGQALPLYAPFEFSLLTKYQAEKVEEEERPFELKDLSLSIGRKELIAVIGGVGSGKSSFLAALAGDMRRTKGEVMIGASRAFCPQYAWIQNATVRDNIIFGKDFRHDWYNEVVDACALRPDLDMLPNHDKTEIGERGITVSGGQKQRMNIARAIYFDADIVLMDDPLSAVDAHVGRHIMDNAICGLLQNKCRILATHQLHVLDRCDRIVWIEEGRIQAVDTFPNLMANNKDFKQLMTMTATEEAKEEQENAVEEEIEDEKKTAKKTKKKKPAAALMQEEDRATKAVDWDVWLAYLRAGGGLWVGPVVVLLLILSQGANIATSLWLSWWTSNKYGYSEGAYVSTARCAYFSWLNLVDRNIRGTRRLSGSTHVCIFHRRLCFWHRGGQSHAAPCYTSSPASTNVFLRHHTSRTYYKSLLKGHRCHG